MAFLHVRVPEDISRVLSQVVVPGKRESYHHITLVNFGDDMPMDQVSKCIVHTFSVARQTRPFTVEIREVSTFPPGDNGTPVICPVISPSLMALHQRLTERYDLSEVSFSKKFPVYRPHVTLSYADSAKVSGPMPLPLLRWGVGELVLSTGDSTGEGIQVTFPLAFAPPAKLFRAFVRAALLGF